MPRLVCKNQSICKNKDKKQEIELENQDAQSCKLRIIRRQLIFTGLIFMMMSVTVIIV